MVEIRHLSTDELELIDRAGGGSLLGLVERLSG